MRVAVEIEIAEICNRLVSAAGRDFTHAHEASQGLKHLHVDQVRCMKFVPVAKQACLDAGAKRGRGGRKKVAAKKPAVAKTPKAPEVVAAPPVAEAAAPKAKKTRRGGRGKKKAAATVEG